MEEALADYAGMLLQDNSRQTIGTEPEAPMWNVCEAFPLNSNEINTNGHPTRASHRW